LEGPLFAAFGASQFPPPPPPKEIEGVGLLLFLPVARLRLL
jgi:hypothetical protein